MNSTIKVFLSLFLIFAGCAYAADTASILPPAKTTFFDQNGKPLTSGKVFFYTPGTTTLKPTWQNSAETVTNSNPVILDAGGRALILGSGAYRQVVKDRNDNVIWDQVTASPGGNSGGGSSVGDGLAVGSIMPWSGFTTPVNYQFTYGQELNRTTYSSLMSILTLAQSVTCVSGNATLNTVADTTQLNVGAKVEGSCIPANSVIVAKTPSTVTLNNLASVSTTVTATFFPYGNGNGTNTFNVPDYRGVVLPGRCNMGGAACSVLTNPTYTDPNALNGSGGNQTTTLLTANLPPYTPTGGVSSSLVNGGNTLYGFIIPGTNVGVGGAETGGSQTQVTTQLSITSNFTGTAAPGQISTPFRTIQPSKTANYIIKVSPDVNLSIARCADISDAGTACAANTGISGHSVPFLDQANTFSANQTFSTVAIAGGTITGMPNPTIAADVANKAYVDSVATGLNILASSDYATTTVLPNSPTYANGASGVGATLTAGSNSTLTVDGTVAVLNKVVLVKNQASTFQNGIYKVTTAGSGATPWVLTRVTYFDQAAEMKAGSYTFVTAGVTLLNTSYTLSAAVATVGTDPLVWNLFASSNGLAGPYVMPNQYGITCDGVTDWAVALQTMISASTGKTIFIPPGPACLSSAALTLPSNTTIIGGGREVSVLKCSATPCLYGNNVSNISISNFQILGTNSAVSWAASNFGPFVITQDSSAVASGSNYTINGMKFSGFNATYWIYFSTSGSSFSMSNIDITNNSWLSDASSVPTDANPFNNSNSFLTLFSATAGNGRISNLNISNNLMEATGMCFAILDYANTYKFKVASNNVLNPGVTSPSHCTNALGFTNTYGIAIYDLNGDGNPASNGLVTGNYILNPRASGIYWVGDGSSASMISNNLIEGQSNSDAFPRGGIVVNGQSDISVIGNSLIGNQNGIFISSQTSGTVAVISNYCRTGSGSGYCLNLAAGAGAANTDKRIVRNNHFEADIAISMLSTTGSRFNDVDISSNFIYGNTSAVIMGGNYFSGISYFTGNNIRSGAVNFSSITGSLLLANNLGLSFTNATLPAAANSSNVFVSDGTPASSPCTGFSTGSNAFRQNGAWKCF